MSLMIRHGPRERPDVLRPLLEGLPQQPQEGQEHRRAGRFVDAEVELPVELHQPRVAGLAGGEPFLGRAEVVEILERCARGGEPSGD